MKPCLLVLVFSLWGLASGCSDEPSKARSGGANTVAGQIQLNAEEGLSDLRRVTVSIDDRTTTPGEGGDFELTSVPAGRQKLTVRYAGSLLSADDAESAYRPFEAPITVGTAAVNAGLVRLEPGSGSVSGTVSFTGTDTPDGAAVRLSKGGHVLEGVVAGGAYSFPDVSVGRYQLAIQRDGYASCEEEVVVASHGQEVNSPMSMSSKVITFDPAGQTNVNRSGSDWFLLDALAAAASISVNAPFATQARMWPGGDAPPEYSAFNAANTFDTQVLSEGRTEYNFQFRNDCGFESDLFTLALVRDVTPPIVDFVQLNNGIPASRSRTVGLTVAARDEIAKNLEMRVALCDVGTGPALTCSPALEDAPWNPYSFSESVTFTDVPGSKAVQVQVRDPNDNRTDIFEGAVDFDPTPPEGVEPRVEDILVGEEHGVVHTHLPLVTIGGSDIAEMKVGTQAGLGSVAWQPFQESFRFELIGDDGPKAIYFRFRDAAGNETDEIVVFVQLDTKGTLKGTFFLPSSQDHAGVEVSLLGTNHATTTSVDGSWTLQVPEGSYSLLARKDGYREYRIPSVVIAPNTTVDLGEVFLDDFRAQIVGQVVLEGFEDQLKHNGATVQLTGTAYSTVTDSVGTFSLGAPSANYPEGLSVVKPGYKTFVRPEPIFLGQDATFNLGIIFLEATHNDLSGRVTLEDAPDGSGITVTINGESGGPVAGVARTTSTDTKGDFGFQDLPVGSYRLSYAYVPEATRETYALGGIVVAAGLPTQVAPVVLRSRFVYIDDHAPATKSSRVTLALGASDCREMQVSNLDTFVGATWQPCAATLGDWALGAGDGQKTVYARFKTGADPVNPTNLVSDSIQLDTVATISAFTHDGGGRVLGMGSLLHLSMTAEPGGQARAAIAGYQPDIALFDDGTQGDTTQGDGIYQRDYTITRVDDVSGAAVTGYFTDAIGNNANRNAATTVTVTVPPLITNVVVVANTQDKTATVSWHTDEDSTGVVNWGPASNSYPGAAASGTLKKDHSSLIGDGSLEPGRTYYLQIAATDAKGNAASSSEYSFQLIPSKPTYVAAIPGINRAWLRWEAASMAPMLGYNVYRALSDTGPFTKLNASPFNDEVFLYRDPSAVNGTTYHYKVAGIDPAGNEGLPSDVVTATPGPSTGPTNVAGDYEGTTVWSEIGSPYVMTGGVAVGKNQLSLLVVGPNTEVRADGAYRLMIRKLGRIAAMGERGTTSKVEGRDVESEDGMVKIVSNKAAPAAGDWNGVYLEPFVATDAVAPPAILDLNDGRYFAGNLLYRTRVSHSGQGGVRAQTTSVTLLRSVISSNRVWWVGAGAYGSKWQEGGGVYVGAGPKDVWIGHSTVSSNTAAPPSGAGNSRPAGGGVAIVGGRVLVSDSLISGNVAITRHDAGRGGGIAIGECPTSTGGGLPECLFDDEGRVIPVAAPVVALVRNHFFANRSSRGGALSFEEGSSDSTNRTVVDGCVFEGNVAEWLGGTYGAGTGAAIGNGFSAALNMVIANSTFVRNEVAGRGYASVLYTEGGSSAAAGPTPEVYGSSFIGNGAPVSYVQVAGAVRNVAQLRACTFSAPKLSSATQTLIDNLVESSAAATIPGVLAFNHFLVAPDQGAGISMGSGKIGVARGNSFLWTTAPAVSTTDAFTKADLDALSNYWGATSTGQIMSGGNPKNVSSIWDYYDDVELAQVDYSNFATTAFPMPRVTAPRWGYQVRKDWQATFTGYGYDLEDSAAAGCATWVSLDSNQTCNEAVEDQWWCKRCPLSGPELCAAACYLGPAKLEWCSDEACTTTLGTGATLVTSFSTVGSREVWLRAYDSNGQYAAVPTRVEVVP